MKNKLTGVVVSDKMDKTVIVLTERKVKHKLYHKYIKRHVRLAVHDEDNRCKIGDKVSIYESRPLSKNKKWIINNIIMSAI